MIHHSLDSATSEIFPTLDNPGIPGFSPLFGSTSQIPDRIPEFDSPGKGAPGSLGMLPTLRDSQFLQDGNPTSLIRRILPLPFAPRRFFSRRTHSQLSESCGKLGHNPGSTWTGMRSGFSSLNSPSGTVGKKFFRLGTLGFILLLIIFIFWGEYSNPNLGSCLRSRTLIPSSAPASSREKFQPGLEDVGNGEASPSPGGFFGSFDHSGIKKMGIFLLLFCIRLWLPASPGDRESIPGFSRAAEPALPILHPRKIPFFPHAGTRG